MNYSRQREQILDYLKSVYKHPTAEEIYKEIKKENVNISLGTVYRNLDILSNNGKIRRIKLANQKDKFDYNTLPHYHALCSVCGALEDVYIDDLEYLNRYVEKCINCDTLSHEIIFNVICSKCKNK